MIIRTSGNARPSLALRRAIMALTIALLGLAGGCGQAEEQAAVPPTPTSPPPTPTSPPPTATTVRTSPAYWPTTGWRTSTPEEQGVDSQLLLKALQHVDEAGINLRSLTVIRNGYIVLETYYQPWTPDLLYQVQSVTKSVTGALTGIAINDGYLKDVKQPVLGFFPDRTIANLDANKQAITIENLLTLQPGLDCSDNKIGASPPAGKDWVQYALDLPMASPPGQKFVYCTLSPHLLSAVLTKATGMSTAAYAQPRLFSPLGIKQTDVTWPTDPQGINIGGYGMWMKPRDMAKLGLLYLNGGSWDGKQIVPAEWVATSTAVHASETGEAVKDKKYGYLFWVYSTHYAAEGLGEQMVQVVKDRNMVVVMTSAIDYHKGPVVLNLLRDYIIPAASSDKPLPANPSAEASLQARVRYLADPVKPVQPLPAIARQVSGKTYVMQDNPAGWKMITLGFQEGAPEATASLLTASGPVTVTVGLDNVYRLQRSPDDSFSARRGQWVDQNTFVDRELQSTDLLEEEVRLTFTGNQLKVHVDEMIFGGSSFDMQGTAK